MSQFNNRYRLFFKKLTDLSGNSLTSPQLSVISYNVKRDLLTKATSSFDVLEVPSAIESGDVVGMYDAYGSIVYLGVVEQIKDSTVEAEQIYGLFDDDWLFSDPAKPMLEDTIKDIITNDFQNNRDTLMNDIFGSFVLSTTSATALSLESQEANYVTNFMSFLYDLYEKYNIVLRINVPFEADAPTIEIGRPNYDKLVFANNVYVFRNFNITREVFENNKLIVYAEDGTYRGEWFTTPSGITDIPTALNRIPKIKTNIIFSDDDINVLKASSLRNEIYNHQIECELITRNNLINFDNLKLGQEADIYYNGNYFNSVLTGYSMSMKDGKEDEVVKLTFGLVRDSLTSKLFKRLAK